MGQGDDLKLVFKNALHHYNKILHQLNDEKEFGYGDPIFEGDILNNIEKNSEIIKKLDSTYWTETLNQNRKFLCECLQGYILHLEKTKSELTSRFQNTYSLPVMDLDKIDNEIELGKKILENSCKNQIG
jgi:hypothetical protein